MSVFWFNRQGGVCKKIAQDWAPSWGTRNNGKKNPMKLGEVIFSNDIYKGRTFLKLPANYFDICVFRVEFRGVCMLTI